MASGLNSQIVLDLMKDGVRQSDIAREYGVSRQYVGKLAKEGGYESAITEVTENMPWEVPVELSDNTLYRAVRLSGHYMATQGEGITSYSIQKIRALYRKLATFQQVVDYDPSYPAIPGVVNTTGFAYVPRTPEDEDFIIKIKPGVTITEIGNKIWRMPEVWP